MNINFTHETSFHKELQDELNNFTTNQSNRFAPEETLTIDLHCHDYNSDVPDEILGRILKVPETWLPTKDLLKTLKKHGCNAYTVTNHNNARTIWELKDKGFDILPAAEFSCMVPEYKVGIHVLTYGFSPKQEKVLNKLRQNLYSFLEYTCENDIPTIWAHPLYNYYAKENPPIEFFEKMALVFERFEVLNGQRDTWQNMLVKIWIESLDKDKIDSLSTKFGIDSKRYCRDPYRKSMSGGSDSHMGIFSGLTGTKLYVPGLKSKLLVSKASDLALEAIKQGNMAPFGSHNNNEKMTVAFLDYVFQVALNYKDAGIVRMLLHKGSARDKLIALLVSNAFSELQKHKVTMNFIKLFHKSFNGEKPHFIKKIFVSKAYKPIFDDAIKIADARKNNPEKIISTFTEAIYGISQKLDNVLEKRITKKLNKLNKSKQFETLDIEKLIEKLELPSNFRSLMESPKAKAQQFNFSEFIDGLSFPFLTSGLILAANFMSARVLYNARPLLGQFAENIGRLKHPKRMLWLTDTFDDNNGVSMVLKSLHQEIKKQKLPIDILVCSNTLKSEENLIVVKSIMEFALPMYQQQIIKVPRVLDIQKIFMDGEYDRIMCSTEGPMGLVALFLKNAFFVEANFYIHTDWMVFARKVLKMDNDNLSRIRRFMRAFYQNFDRLFVLNTDQQKWLTDTEMGFNPDMVKLTAHWADEEFVPRKSSKQVLFDIPEKQHIVLYAGRLSKEKGVMELPNLYQEIKSEIPDVTFVIAGNGPMEEKLKAELPEAKYLGWVKHDELPDIYSASDILVLPSKFDTFSCVVLEALNCGLPVISYNTKGPKDIIIDGKTGFLVSHKKAMKEKLLEYLKDIKLQDSFKKAALKRGKDYNSGKITEKLLTDIGIQ
jgi:glycosyltransferase involved in cell wall biosynthesis